MKKRNLAQLIGKLFYHTPFQFHYKLFFCLCRIDFFSNSDLSFNERFVKGWRFVTRDKNLRKERLTEKKTSMKWKLWYLEGGEKMKSLEIFEKIRQA